MKLLQTLVAVLLAPLLLTSSAFADEKDKEKKEAAKTSKPSLTYYYFDG